MVLGVAVGIRAQHHVEIGAGGTADLTQVTPCAAAGTELLGHRQFRAVAPHEAPDVDGAAMGTFAEPATAAAHAPAGKAAGMIHLDQRLAEDAPGSRLQIGSASGWERVCKNV